MRRLLFRYSAKKIKVVLKWCLTFQNGLVLAT